jgi:hypothetical protein
MDGAQLVDGQWWHPVFGCDSLQYVVDNARQSSAPQIAIPAEQYQFNPKQSTTPMTVDPTSIEPSDELIRKRAASNTSYFDDYIFFARWGARQAVEALRHQWPEPITDRPPTAEDASEGGLVQFLDAAGRWGVCDWQEAAEVSPAWRHVPNWLPRPKVTLKQQALRLLSQGKQSQLNAETFFAAFNGHSFTAEQIAMLRQVVESAPDTTP